METITIYFKCVHKLMGFVTLAMLVCGAGCGGKSATTETAPMAPVVSNDPAVQSVMRDPKLSQEQKAQIARQIENSRKAQQVQPGNASSH